MRRSRTPAVAAAFWALGIAVAVGSTPNDVAAALRDAKNQANPPAAFWSAIARMPDFSMTGDQLRAAVQAAGTDAPVDPFFASFVGNARTFTKRGSDVSIDVNKNAASAPQMPLVTSDRVTFRVTPDGNTVALDGLRGVNINSGPGQTPAIDRVSFKPNESGQPVMDVSASLGDRHLTRTIDLADYGIRRGAGNVGVVGRLDEVTNGRKGPGTAPVASQSSTAPVTSQSSPTRNGDVAPTTSTSTYTIELGDTLWDIGRANGMTVDQLLDYDGGTGKTNRVRLAESALNEKHRGDPNWIWHPQEIVLPAKAEPVTPRRHDWKGQR